MIYTACPACPACGARFDVVFEIPGTTWPIWPIHTPSGERRRCPRSGQPVPSALLAEARAHGGSR